MKTERESVSLIPSYKNINNLEYIEIQITDSCNLNCKGCSHLAGLYSGEQHIPLKSFKKDVCRLKELFSDIEKIRLLGGEPFLNPKLSEYCKITRKLYPDSNIRVVTNGLLCLSCNEEIYENFRKYSIGIDISLYPPTEKIKEKLIEKFESEKVEYRFTSYINQFAKRIDLCGNSDIQNAFWNCDSKWCTFLRDGLLCICPAPYFLEKLSQQYNFDADVKSGIINIHETMLTATQIKEFINKPNDVCRYCSKMEFFEWEMNKKPSLSDWLVDDDKRR